MKRLFVTTAEYGRALIMPPVEGESSVAVYSVKHGDKELETRVAYTQVDQNMRYLQYKGNSNSSDSPPFQVKHVEAAIPKSTALAVRKAWKAMLCHNGPETPNKGGTIAVDTVAVEFSLVDDDGNALYAQLAQTRGKNTDSLFSLAQLLITYCKSDLGKRAPIAQDIERNANSLADKAAE